jgi:hypothetical protein
MSKFMSAWWLVLFSTPLAVIVAGLGKFGAVMVIVKSSFKVDADADLVAAWASEGVELDGKPLFVPLPPQAASGNARTASARTRRISNSSLAAATS